MDAAANLVEVAALAVRFARSCYDHLAGQGGVAVTDARRAKSSAIWLLPDQCIRHRQRVTDRSHSARTWIELVYCRQVAPSRPHRYSRL